MRSFFAKIPLRILSHAVAGYMLLAFVWWSVHLWRQDERLFEVKKQLLELRFNKDNRGLNQTQFEETREYKTLVYERDRAHRMIASEAIFFTACLFFGTWVINRSARRETALARQRRNFMLSITHELKSPIASMRLVLETLAKRQLERPQVETLCQNGLRDAARLQTLVEDLLLAARLEDNWRPLPEPVHLEDLAHDAVARLQVRFPDRHIELDIPDDLPPIRADRSGLTSVVMNLLENAVKYSPEDTTVQMSAKAANGIIRFEVSDQGEGIPEAERRAVFEKFYRLGNEETRKATGTGLGLYIVQHVLRAHGGSIEIQENKPQGAKFVVTMNYA
ncbi:MAG: GHKL domain-containing protein [Chitinophagales bacterium]|nr:GHKL domain-containing protein [Chitinophagales bacterium]